MESSPVTGEWLRLKQLGWTEVPTIRLSYLSEDDRRAYILADNKLAENVGWDEELLAIVLQRLIEIDFDLGDIGLLPLRSTSFLMEQWRRE